MVVYDKIPRIAESVAISISRELATSRCLLSKVLLSDEIRNEEIIVFLIPIYGEEELNEDWLNFFDEVFAKGQVKGVKLIVYFFGVYDKKVCLNSAIVNQIRFFTRYNSVHLKIYPTKLSKYDYSPQDVLKFIINSKDKDFSKTERLLEKLIFKVKDIPEIYDGETLSLTSTNDGYSNILTKLNSQEQIDSNLSKILSSFSGSRLIINRLKYAKLVTLLSQAYNPNVKVIHLKSCNLTEIPFLKGFSNAEVINLSANKIRSLDCSKFPLNVRRINVSKNRISNITWDNKLTNVKEISLFNNSITSLSGISVYENLEYLNLGLNPIGDIPLEIQSLKKIVHLNVALTKIKSIPRLVFNLPKIEILDVKNCSFLKVKNEDFLKLESLGVNIIC